MILSLLVLQISKSSSPRHLNSPIPPPHHLTSPQGKKAQHPTRKHEAPRARSSRPPPRRRHERRRRPFRRPGYRSRLCGAPDAEGGVHDYESAGSCSLRGVQAAMAMTTGISYCTVHSLTASVDIHRGPRGRRSGPRKRSLPTATKKTHTTSNPTPPQILSSPDPKRPFEVAGSTFPDFASAFTRSCNNQHNACAAQANGALKASLTVSQCDVQQSECALLPARRGSCCGASARWLRSRCCVVWCCVVSGRGWEGRGLGGEGRAVGGGDWDGDAEEPC
jgi:hypothetical protein